MRVLVIGGSDAGVSAGLRVREYAPSAEVRMLVADAYPNFSICGIPYHVSGEVPDWRDLAHRGIGGLETAGIRLHLNEPATDIDPIGKTVTTTSGSQSRQHAYDQLVIATGAVPLLPPIDGLLQLGPGAGVHLLHTIDDTLVLTEDLDRRRPGQVAIIGAGYIGMEMAEALTTRGFGVTVFETYDQVLPRTLDPELAAEVETELAEHGVEVQRDHPITTIAQDGDRLTLTAADGSTHRTDVVLVAGGVRPASGLAAKAGVALDYRGAIVVDRHMRTSIPDIYAAGDCVHTHHVLLDQPTYLPLGTTAHKQGRVAGENAAGGDRAFAGVTGTQVVRVFDRVIAATGLRDQAARDAGYQPCTVETVADDHKRYYPGATPIRIRLTGDARTGRLLGAQLVGQLGAEIAKRIDTIATACQHGLTVEQLNDLDLSYTPPLGSPWDAIQLATQAWTSAAAARH
jgi:NADPH-dependent 2,4-dienoyl-CoA reductase/sulfur reductase-like enzyme